MRLLTTVGVLAVLNSNAQVTWRRTYGGFGIDRAYCVRQTTDGGYIVVGSTGSFGAGGGDVYALRLDPFGEPLWTRTYGNIGVDEGMACRELSDGFVIAGSTSIGDHGGYDMLLIRTDASGNALWTEHYGTTEWDLCRSIGVMADGFLLGGTSYGDGYPAGGAYFVRTDLDGDTLWTSSWGGAYGMECNGLCITMDQGYAAVGQVATPAGPDDAFIAKFAEDGSFQWTTALGGDSADYFNNVIETQDNSLVSIGGSRSYASVQQIYLVSVADSGQYEWERLIGNTTDAGGAEVRPDHGGGYVFTGYNTLNFGERDIILTVTDDDGWFQFGNNYGDGQPADGYSIDTTFDGGYVVAGWAENFGPGPRAMYVVKTDSVGNTDSLGIVPYLDALDIQEHQILVPLQLYPNPCSAWGLLQVFGIKHKDPLELLLFDPLGRPILSTTISSSNSTIQLNGLSPGPYTVQIRERGMPVHSELLIVQ